MCHQVNQPHAKEHQANSDLDEMAAILLCHNLFTYDVLSTLIWASHCIAKELNSSFTVSVFHFCSLSAHGVVNFSLRSSLGKVYCRWNFLQCKATLGKHHFDDNLRIWNIYTVYAFFGDKNSDLFDVKKSSFYNIICNGQYSPSSASMEYEMLF